MNKIQVSDKNLHEIKNEILRDYTGEIEMNGNLKIGVQNCQIHFIFTNIANYETCINATDQDYDSEDALFNGYI